MIETTIKKGIPEFQYTKLQQRITKLQNKLYSKDRLYEILLCETSDKEGELERKIKGLEMEILILKGKLYDKGEEK